MLNASRLGMGCRPPDPPQSPFVPWVRRIACLLIALFITAIVTAFSKTTPFWPVYLGIAVPLLAMAVVVDLKQAKYNASYPQLLADWEASWLCMSCGGVARD